MHLDLQAQVSYTLCADSKNIKYQVAGNPGSIFHWSVEGGQIISDPHGSTIIVNWENQQGEFTVSVFEETNTGCLGNTMKTRIKINPSPVINLGESIYICEGKEVELSPGIGFNHYQWQDRSTGPVYIANRKGIYWVEVTNGYGCSSRDTVEVEVNPLPRINLGNDIAICDPDVIVIDAGSYGVTYKWNNDENSQTIIAHEGDGQIWVKVTDANGCIGYDTIQILTCLKQNKLEIPNALTPNGDGHNDYWQIEGSQKYPDMSVKIFDRWGIQVFTSEQGYPKPWDGTSNGKPLPSGAYYYIIKLGDGSKEIAGSLTLIR
jgi:gliding motility-associated-like protein